MPRSGRLPWVAPVGSQRTAGATPQRRLCDPAGGDGLARGAGFRGCRFAQPPATFLHPSGMAGRNLRCGRLVDGAP